MHNLRHTASFHDPAKTRNQPPKQIFYLLFNKIARIKYKWITPEDHESIRNRQTQSTLTLRRQHRSSVTFKQIQEYQHVDRRSPFRLFHRSPERGSFRTPCQPCKPHSRARRTDGGRLSRERPDRAFHSARRHRRGPHAASRSGIPEARHLGAALRLGGGSLRARPCRRRPRS